MSREAQLRQQVEDQEREIVYLRVLLSKMLHQFGNPRREEWLSWEAWQEAKSVCNEVRETLGWSRRE